MKKQRIVLFIISFLLFIFLYFFCNLDSLIDNLANKILNGTNEENVTLTWNDNDYISWFVEQWWVIFTWLNIEDIWDLSKEETDETKYIEFKKNWNFVSFVPSSQIKIDWNYSTRTDYMNTYIANNTFKFDLPMNINKWYLYIRLKKPSSDWIFLVWYGSNKWWYKVSWDLKLDDSLLTWSNSEYLFNLKDIPYVRYNNKKLDTYNRLSELKEWKSNFIAGFLRVYDWSNKIEQIAIAWE